MSAFKKSDELARVKDELEDELMRLTPLDAKIAFTKKNRLRNYQASAKLEGFRLVTSAEKYTSKAALISKYAQTSKA